MEQPTALMPFNSLRHTFEVQQYTEHNFTTRTHGVVQLSYFWAVDVMVERNTGVTEIVFLKSFR